MALLVLWQATSALLHYFADDTADDNAVTDFFFGLHFTAGFTIFILAVLRDLWGLINLSRRPLYCDALESPGRTRPS